MNLTGPLPPAEQAHCRRTAALSELLAKLAGFPDSEVRTVTQSALVHDIGKTAIPASILCKPGPLTAEERAIMQMHTAIGAHTTVVCWLTGMCISTTGRSGPTVTMTTLRSTW